MSSSNVPSAKRSERLVAACTLAILVVSTASFFVLKNTAISGEKTFADAALGRAAPLGVYVDVLAIDPVRESMNLRLDVATGSGPRGTEYYSPLHRDVALGVSDGETQQEYRFKRNTLVSSREFAASLRGSIGFYPLDRYTTQIVVIAHDFSTKDSPVSVPLRLTIWGGIPGWAVSVTKVRPSTGIADSVLNFSIYRPAPLVLFACVLYGIMVLIAASAIIIGTLIFVGIRQVEPTLISALAAMVFALPALRNLLPGAPPLGVLADVVIVLWAELAVAAGLIMIVLAWARRGSK